MDNTMLSAMSRISDVIWINGMNICCTQRHYVRYTSLFNIGFNWEHISDRTHSRNLNFWIPTHIFEIGLGHISYKYILWYSTCLSWYMTHNFIHTRLFPYQLCSITHSHCLIWHQRNQLSSQRLGVGLFNVRIEHQTRRIFRLTRIVTPICVGDRRQ